MQNSLKILFSPLDWGLGHATRSISILRYIQEQGHQIIIAANDSTESILKEQFPDVSFHDAPSYNIKYSKRDSSLSLVKLIPKILKAKRRENSWLKQFVKENKVDLIISDSRFGFYHSTIPSVIISHQLKLEYPKSFSIFGKIAQKVNERWLSKFSQIWVPDNQDSLLSGDLSINPKLVASFIGIQSRFIRQDMDSPLEQPFILYILSGPEPQRTAFEDLIISQANKTEKKIIIIGGQPQKVSDSYEMRNITFYNHLEDEKLSAYIQNASLIISRSGYSSLMDYYTFACSQVFLIPTPGQTEQIYLAKRLKELEICNFCSQNQFNLDRAIMENKGMKGFENIDTKDNIDLSFIK